MRGKCVLTWELVVKLSQNGNLRSNRRIVKTDKEWQALLTAEQYYVTRQAGTEPAFSSDTCAYFSHGVYTCVCCHEVLFNADSQFDSGSGWPSFNQPANEDAIAYYADHSHHMVRIEAKCNCCDAHLGHVFSDGPPPSGLRYCMNALALNKHEEGFTHNDL